MEGRGYYPVSLVNHPWQNYGLPFNYCKLLNFLTAGGLDVDMQGPIRACSLLGHQESLLTLNRIFSSSWKPHISFFWNVYAFDTNSYGLLFNHDPMSPGEFSDQRHLWDQTLRWHCFLSNFSQICQQSFISHFVVFFLTHGLVAQRTGSLVAKQIPRQKTKCRSPILQVSPIYKRLFVSPSLVFKRKSMPSTQMGDGRWNGFFS